MQHGPAALLINVLSVATAWNACRESFNKEANGISEVHIIE
jgi:hypothetical protein